MGHVTQLIIISLMGRIAKPREPCRPKFRENSSNGPETNDTPFYDYLFFIFSPFYSPAVTSVSLLPLGFPVSTV